MRPSSFKPAARLAALLFLACLLHPAARAQGAGLAISGDFLPERVFSAAELERLPHTEIVVSRATQAGDKQALRQIAYRGILLRELLQAAGMNEGERRDMRRLLLVARARDGYLALFTWAEIFNSPAGEQVLVVDAVDGKPLGEQEGPLALRAFGDFRPGPRHVKWLEKIELRQVR